MKTYQDYFLKNYNTFGIEAKCRLFIAIEDECEAPYAIVHHLTEGKRHVLGGGSNVLFVKDFSGVVVQMQSKGIEIISEDESSVKVRVSAGETWEDFVNYCVENGYYGVENLIGIPGLVGSCPVQNIGAYGAEVKDVIYRVEGFFLDTAEPFVLTNAQCKFAYRDSIFKNEYKNKCLITSVIFLLSKQEKYNLSYSALAERLQGEELSLAKVAATVSAIRKSKLPDVKELGSAGSFFKNPIVSEERLNELLKDFPNLIYHKVNNGMKLAAGQLIDLCGWKGKREGQVGTYPKQALVIVNYGGATGYDVVHFFKSIQQSVYDTFGVHIDPEVNIL